MTNMYILKIKSQEELNNIKAELSALVEDVPASIKMFNKIFLCDNIEIFFHDSTDGTLRNIINNSTIRTTHLDKNSIIGKVFLNKKSYVKNNITDDKRYDVALDNPYKIEMNSQIILSIIHNKKLLGIVRLSSVKKFEKLFVDRIRLFISSFKDILLNEIYKQKMNISKEAFTTTTTEVYLTLKKIKNLYSDLENNTEHPEIKKLIHAGDVNIDTILEYVNPNIDNVSAVKQQLRAIKSSYNNSKNKQFLRVLIADDVIMNVKILNSMIMDENVDEIKFAYDGIETIDKMVASYENGNIINILFLDHHMPGKLGSEVAEMLRKKGQNLTIISITNDPEAIEDKQSLYDYHLSKPFEKHAIVSIFDDIYKQNNAIK